MILGLGLLFSYWALEQLGMALSAGLEGAMHWGLLGMLIAPIFGLAVAVYMWKHFQAKKPQPNEALQFFGYGVILLGLYTGHYAWGNIIGNLYFMFNWMGPEEHHLKPTLAAQIPQVFKAILSILFIFVGFVLIKKSRKQS